MKILISSDWHVRKQDFAEIRKVLEEIYFTNDAEETWIIGDLFDNKRPSPEEYNFLTKILMQIATKMRIVIISGNHDDISKSISALDYVEHLGIELHKFSCVKEINGKKIYLGHHLTDMSDPFITDCKYKVEDLEKDYDYAFLGDYHEFMELGNHTWHLGNIIFKSFKEVNNVGKKYAILEDNFNITFKEITCTIPMYDIHDITKLDNIDSISKVRLIFNSTQGYLQYVNELKQYKKKFHQFVIKKDYGEKRKLANIDKKEIVTFREIFTKWLNKEVKIKKVKQFIESVL